MVPCVDGSVWVRFGERGRAGLFDVVAAGGGGICVWLVVGGAGVWALCELGIIQ